MLSLGAWTALLAAYLLFAGDLSVEEVSAGILCASAATLWWRAIDRASPTRFCIDTDGWWAIGRAIKEFPWATVQVAAMLFRALVRPVDGRIFKQPFFHGAQDQPIEATRRGLVVLALSLAPDSYVMRMRAGRDEIEIHSLTGSVPRSDMRWPI